MTQCDLQQPSVEGKPRDGDVLASVNRFSLFVLRTPFCPMLGNEAVWLA